MLRVFRIPLPDGNTVTVPSKDSAGEQEGITTIAEPFPLPRSARKRLLYLYLAPADDPHACARAILGATHGNIVDSEPAQPPAMVYLGLGSTSQGNSDAAPGEWVPANEGVMSRSRR